MTLPWLLGKNATQVAPYPEGCYLALTYLEAL
jgi:hypothetical protein